jgi:enoyl-CoA hydratase
VLQLVRRDRVLLLSLDRPPVNAIDGTMVDALTALAATVSADQGIGAVVFSSAGRLFSAGADLKAIRALIDEDGPAAAGDLVERMQSAFSAIAALPVPTVAAIRGAALGGGLELALACDLRVAAADAKIGLPEVGHGLLPGAGGTQRLTAVAGPAVAARMIMTGEVVDGSAAQALGIVQWAAPAEEVDGLALELGEQLAKSPAATAAIKNCIRLAGSASGYEHEIAATRMLYATDEVQRQLATF